MSQDLEHRQLRALTLSDFGYDAPERLVAQEPSQARDQARLLVRTSDGTIRHRRVLDLTSELPRGSLLILNDTKVFPSRLVGRLATGGQVELFLIAVSGDSSGGQVWKVLGRPLKKLEVGRTVHFDEGVTATVVGKQEEAGHASATVRFDRDPVALAAWIDRNGFIPLPPYIKRPQATKAPDSPDRERYQTVFARERGSVAAPTAGLHFTDALLAKLAEHGIETKRVVLHVGAGTFLPVKTDTLAEHTMHEESYFVPRETAKAITDARAAGRKVIAVGTTSLRSLEDLARRADGDATRFVQQADAWHATRLFLYPKTTHDRVKPWAIDGLFTNFHQPHSTLLMLVSALFGVDEIKRIYAEAIAAEYRLYSYGDASLLWL